MEISQEKSKILIKCNGCGPNFTLYGEQFENVKTFKYLDAMLTENETSKKEILIRLAITTAAMVRLEKIWKAREIEFKLRYKFYKSLVLSILLYGYETWTLLEEYK